LSHEQRIKLWERELNLSSEDIPYLQEAAGLFYFTGGQIKDAASTALNLAGQRSGRKLEKEDVFAACRLQSNRKLKDLARKITPNYRWEDIVLPKDRMAQLKDICSYVKYRALVYDTWGFKEKMSLGRGLNVIFSGPSGTGKTMSADIIAKELGLDLYKIDLSRIVSKYIGETEKNLSKIFEEAETSNSILFFDEADSIFGKRSEVKDAHDRYANIETGYLLQKMEEHTGIVILATNFRQNMDKAFLRRMHFIVDFPNPDKEDRHRIWKRIWPAKVPLNENIDFNSISSKFDVSGGNIKNIALSSAFLAAGQDTEVSMENIIKSIKREYQKMGKVVMEDDFAFDCEKRE
jgi:SpoVK/Ycf46/Vps4 family AAA+-type ATPase